jgi:hypothetical protein
MRAFEAKDRMKYVGAYKICENAVSQVHPQEKKHRDSVYKLELGIAA